MRLLRHLNKLCSRRFVGGILALALVLPLVGSPVKADAAYSVAAAGAVVMDVETGQVLFDQNSDAKLYPASTTKIMTALLVLENLELDDKIRVPDDFVNDGEASIWLEPGEEHTVEALMMAMMLRSANDAAQVLAIGVAGSEEAFAEMMSEKAASLGCENTHFTSPNGLHDPEHYTTAYDLALITRAAMEYEDFNRIIVTDRYQMPWVQGEYDRVVYNRNTLLDLWEAADGVKNGYTTEAGNCLVSSATVDGRRFIGVVLNCPDMYNASQAMLQYAFDNYQTLNLVKADTVMGEVEVIGGKQTTLQVKTDRDLDTVLPADADTAVKDQIYLPESVYAPVRAGDIIGSVSYTDSLGLTQVANLVACENTSTYSFLQVFKESWTSLWQVFVVPINKQ